MKNIISSSLTESKRSHDLNKLKEEGERKKGSSTAFRDLANRFSTQMPKDFNPEQFGGKRIDLNKLDKFESKHNSMKMKPQVIDETENVDEKPKQD